MTEKILLINVHSSRNAGDAALTQVTLQQIAENFPGSQVTLSMDDPESHLGPEQAIGSVFTWLKRTTSTGQTNWRMARVLWLLPASLLPILSYRWRRKPIYVLTPKSLRSLMQAYLDADLAISKPGGFLYSSGSGLSLALGVYTMALALLAGKPVYMFPQSVGPLRRTWESLLIRWLLGRVRIVMVREEVSLRLLQACGVRNPRLYLVPDVAFALPAAEREAAQTWLQDLGIDFRQNCPLLGMTMMNWGAQNPRFQWQARYEDACAAAARFFIEQYHGQVILFPQVWGPLISQDDRVPARRLAERLSDLGRAVRVVEQPLSAELLKAIYGCMDLFIGTRMHSNIFALSQGVPVIAIGYLHKTEGIARMAGVGEWVVDIRTVESPVLIEKVRALWLTRQAWRERIQQVVPKLIEQANLAGKMVAEDFFARREEV